MKLRKLAVAALAGLVILSVAGCSHEPRAESTLFSNPDYAACQEVIQAACSAFNAYDSEKFMSYLTPEYAADAEADIRQQISQFQMGRGMGVKMVVSDFQEAAASPDGALNIRFILSIEPKGLQADQNKMCRMEKSGAEWKIASIEDYQLSNK